MPLGLPEAVGLGGAKGNSGDGRQGGRAEDAREKTAATRMNTGAGCPAHSKADSGDNRQGGGDEESR